MNIIPEYSYTIYCLNYQHETRKQLMKEKLQQLNVPYYLSSGVDFTDPRISSKIDDQLKKVWSNTYGHLENIQRFVESNDEFGIFCEDDIVIHKDFSTKIMEVMKYMKTMKIDIMLLSYLYSTPFYGVNHSTILEKLPILQEQEQEQESFPHTFYTYSKELWGTQMFMYSRQGADIILSTYTPEYATQSIHDSSLVFSADFTLTKCPTCTRALIYPMLAIEDGRKTYEEYGHYGQYRFHLDTFHTHYQPDQYL
jgi:GR25 family glycosyltransferase involved in LPS biosynthesis